MTTIRKKDFIQSVADALQFISYYHPLDFIRAIYRAYQMEQSNAAKDALAQILVNSKMSAEGQRPMCQDTGIVVVFLEVGMDVRWDTDMSVENMINEGVRRGYMHADNLLRASIVSDPTGRRRNTGDNTPAVVHTRLVPGGRVGLRITAKGGGSENKAKLTMLNPSDSIVDWVVDTLPAMGAGWCPPGVLGIGIGGTAEKAALLAKEALLDDIDMHELRARAHLSPLQRLRLEIFNAVNDLGIGAQGLGGLTTVLDVKIKDFPTHAACKPVAMIPNCAANRHIHFFLDGSGPAAFEPPMLGEWPDLSFEVGANVRRVNLDTISRDQVMAWRPGETILLTGKLLTGRDAAHKRIIDMLQKGKPLPAGVRFANRFIYYVGPVDPVRGEVIGPAGPTTATRMDKFTETMLAQTGLLGMIGKGERGQAALDAIKKHRAVYLIAVGGAAYLVSKAIRKSRVLAFEDLGMEAIHEFEVKDMPVTVAVDSLGESVHQTGPIVWQQKIKLLKRAKRLD